MMRFSLTTMLVAVALIALAITAHRYFGLTGLAVFTLIGSIALRSAFRTRGLSTRKWWLLIVPSAAWCILASLAWLVLGHGPVLTRNSWPHGLHQMIEVCDADTEHARVNDLGSFLDTEHVWRIRIPESKIDTLRAEFSLNEASIDDIPSAFWRAFPGWWRPTRQTRMRFFTTAGFPIGVRGEERPHYMALYEPATQRLFVWHKFPF